MRFLLSFWAFWVLWAAGISAFSWRSEAKASTELIRPPLDTNMTLSGHLEQGSNRLNVYSIALAELQQLESEPLCHRVSARLLVNSCQLLDGKDEATILTHSGRQVRDFVDAFAASMAICDLERGGFVIPSSCSKFRETVLVGLPLDTQSRLHVTSKEIDVCLSGLADSNAAWNTWISYRHKALRFCEAARADQEKAQNILIYQRLTRAIAKLANGVEVELQRRMDALDLRAQHLGQSLEGLLPRVDDFGRSLDKFESYLSGDLYQILRKSVKTSNAGLENAANLQQLLTVMINSILEGSSQVAAAHEQALNIVAKGNGDLNTLTADVSAAVSTIVSLAGQIEIARMETLELTTRQQALQEGFDRLLITSAELSSKHDDHIQLLNAAENVTNGILDTLEVAASSATSISDSFFRNSVVSTWWPYLICPAATLFLGSYGLAPSAFRNLGLLALGELVGFAISSLDHITAEFLSFTGNESISNATAAIL